MDSLVHGILQARILEWVAFPFSRGSSQHRDQTQASHTAGWFFTSWATREAQEYWSGSLSILQRIFPTQESNWGLLHCRQILTNWAIREALIYYMKTCKTMWINLFSWKQWSSRFWAKSSWSNWICSEEKLRSMTEGCMRPCNLTQVDHWSQALEDRINWPLSLFSNM